MSDFLSQLPLVAILRGVVPTRVESVAAALWGEGFRAIEVPLNSPDPFASIEILARTFGSRALCGAGTVLTVQDVDRVADAGGQLIVTPNTDARVIGHAVQKGLTVMPGIFSPTEAFAALAAGARHLKLFPASCCGPAHLKAIRAVLPPQIPVYAVGGVGAPNMREWREAGAAGFGLGSEIFKPEFSDAEISQRARAVVAAFKGHQLV